MHDLRAEVEDQEMVTRFARNWREAGLEAPLTALLEYCAVLTRAPRECSQGAVDELRALGWTDRAIHDAVQVCAYFAYINRIAEGLGVDEETWLDALGRPRRAAEHQSEGD